MNVSMIQRQTTFF